jgi:nucleoid DNA-binding protein
MRKTQGMALIALFAVLGSSLVLASQALSQKPGDKPQTVKDRIVKETKLESADVQKMLNALGPAIREQIRTGAQVEIPGLGTFRIVNIPEHRDLVAGRPATVAGSNTVEFLPIGELVRAANSAGAVPAETVPPFSYIVNPYQAPTQRAPTTREVGTRTR